jgi:hypothetical protein
MEPSTLGIEDLDAALIAAFLDHLEKQRRNTAHPQRASGGHPLVLSIRGLVSGQFVSVAPRAVSTTRRHHAPVPRAKSNGARAFGAAMAWPEASRPRLGPSSWRHLGTFSSAPSRSSTFAVGPPS